MDYENYDRVKLSLAISTLPPSEVEAVWAFVNDMREYYCDELAVKNKVIKRWFEALAAKNQALREFDTKLKAALAEIVKLEDLLEEARCRDEELE